MVWCSLLHPTEDRILPIGIVSERKSFVRQLWAWATNSKIVKDLKVDSEMLKHISDSFAYRGAAFKIRSFYETEFMSGLNCCVSK